MNIINQIGQRNISKIIAVISGMLSFIYICYKKSIPDMYGNALTLDVILGKAFFGVLLFATPNIILSFCAVKSKEYRLTSIYLSSLLLFTNTILLLMNFDLILFVTSITEIIGTLFFLFYITKYENKRKKKIIRKKKIDEINNDTIVG
jgi:hypothetical protein